MSSRCRSIVFTFAVLLSAFSSTVKSGEPKLGQAPSALEVQRIDEALSQWEAASQDVLSPTTEDQHVAYVVQKSKCSGHEISVALEFQGPVRIDELQRKYRWQSARETDAGIVLTAEPVEEVEKLFYGGFELQFDPETSLPNTIRFLNRNGVPKEDCVSLSLKTREPIEDETIKLTSAESKRMTQKAPELLQQSEPALTEISPAFEKIIKNWEAASAKRRTLDVHFDRRVYDSTYQTEKLSRGRIYYEAPNKGSIEIEGIKPGAEVSSRKDSETGKPYKLESDWSEHWVWTGQHVLTINEYEKLVEKTKLPEQPISDEDAHADNNSYGGVFARLGQQLILMMQSTARFPLVLGPMKAEELRKNYQLELTQQDSRGAWITAKPRTRRDLANFSKMVLILDEKTHLPQFAKYTDQSGNVETVYFFTNWKVNEPLAEGDRPLDPDLAGYFIHDSQIQFQQANRNETPRP